MACMKKPLGSEAEARANADRINRRKGKGKTQQGIYPCADCTTEGFPTVWHLRTERPIEGRDAKIIELRKGPRRRRPAHRPELDEDYEGRWIA
jgi:hypothetical protein